MLASYEILEGRVRLMDSPDSLASAVWTDLRSPDEEERAHASQQLGVDIPTLEEMLEIEVSSRLYSEDNAVFMTANIISRADGDEVRLSPVTFILTPKQLITVRFEEPKAFITFANRCQRNAIAAVSADAVLVSLLETIIERLADILERATQDIDALSRTVFRPVPATPAQAEGSNRAPRKPRKGRDFQSILESIGRMGDLNSNIRDSLVSLQRLFAFLSQVELLRKPGKDIQARVKTLSRDAMSLSDQASFLSQKITFLLDATLGLISIEQSGIIKIFSVAAVVFLPPTLIASVYGMNFENMPELSWTFGYPFAIALMIMSAILPYLFFKRQGWL